jgi:hypothetical protein
VQATATRPRLRSNNRLKDSSAIHRYNPSAQSALQRAVRLRLRIALRVPQASSHSLHSGE